jgi:hypothetical protein
VTRAALALAALAFLGAAGPASAAFLTLSEAQQAEALRVGQRSVNTEAPFDTEWRIENRSGESVTVMTPFYRLALASRNAAFKSEPIKPQDQDKLLQQVRDRLMVWVELHGPREDFARYYTARLLLAEREIEPSFVQNERTGLRRANGSYLARSVYAFPNREIAPDSKLVLVIRDPGGQQVSRFAIELGRMR